MNEPRPQAIGNRYPIQSCSKGFGPSKRREKVCIKAIGQWFEKSSFHFFFRKEAKRLPFLYDEDEYEALVSYKSKSKSHGKGFKNHGLWTVGANHPDTPMFLASWPSTAPIGVEPRWILGGVTPKKLKSRQRVFSKSQPQRARHAKQPNPKGGFGMKQGRIGIERSKAPRGRENPGVHVAGPGKPGTSGFSIPKTPKG